MATLTVRMPDDTHERLKYLVKARNVSTRQGSLVRRYWQPAIANQGDKAPTSRIELLGNGPR